MQRHSGIGRYIRNLVRAMLTLDPQLDLALAVARRDEDSIGAQLALREELFEAPIYSWREHWSGSALARRSVTHGRVIHIPHYNAPWWLPNPSVITVHDLTHLEFPQYFPTRRVWMARRVLQRAVHRADRIIAVSRATRSALERACPEAIGKAEVIYPGVDPVFLGGGGAVSDRGDPESDAGAISSAEFRQQHGLGRFVLFVGSERPHKNLDGVLRIAEAMRASHPDLQWVIVTPNPRQPNEPEVSSLRQSDATPRASTEPEIRGGVRWVGPLPDAELAQWYSAADALVLPSVNEGFGFPGVEAMACGTPVVASRIPALVEVLGDAALFAHCDDTQDWAHTIGRLLESRELQRERRARGAQQAARYTWSNTARDTLQLYDRVARR